MTKKLLIITETPIKNLFTADESIELRRSRDLGSAEIKDLLRQGPLRFVIANVGRPLHWIPEEETFQFWKEKVIANLVEAKEGSSSFRLEDFPHEYAYTASEWTGAVYRVVLLELHH